MAIGNTTQYGSRTVLKEAYEKGFVRGVYQSNELLSLRVNGRDVFPATPMLGDESSYRWKVGLAL
jgi:hypothetical protein